MDQPTTHKKMLIFVSGPLSADTLEGVKTNIDWACSRAQIIAMRGHVPFIPHTMGQMYDVWHIERFGQPGAYEMYMDWCLTILRRCDAVYNYGPSPGSNREVALARELWLPVYVEPNDIPFLRE